MNEQLQPKDLLRLQRILGDLFSTFDMSNLLLGVNRNIANYAPIGGKLPELIQAVVQSANMELWWRDLVCAARLARPGASQLQAFAQEFGLAMLAANMSSGAPVILGGQALEDMVRPNVPLFDISVFRSRMGEIEGRVCRIECPALNPLGTGFLVGPDTIITNYHVVEKLISATGGVKWSPRDLVARFDFKVGPDGATVVKGTTFGLATDWLIDYSPYSQHDVETKPTGEPADDELDYAILRLDQKAGNLPLFPQDPTSPTRKWIEPAPVAAVPDFDKEKGLFIVQHPDGRPMQVGMDMDSIIGVVGNGTRLRYKTNTLPGSSGSPCFGTKWQWIALHHSGDPKYQLRFNQGILVSAIVDLLEKRGKLGSFGGSSE